MAPWGQRKVKSRGSRWLNANAKQRGKRSEAETASEAYKRSERALEEALKGSSDILQRGDVFRLRSFLTLSHFKGHALTFFQRLAATAINGTKMNKNIGSAFALNKTVTFVIVEPLHHTRYQFI